jgi:hypothetical protein
MGLLIVAFIVLLLIGAMIENGASQEDRKRAADAKANAKVPEYISQMLKEEMPEHAVAFTEARCQAAVKWLASWEARRLFAPCYPAFGTPERKAEARRKASDLMAQRVAPIFGEEVKAMAQRDPKAFHTVYHRCAEAAAAKAKATA